MADHWFTCHCLSVYSKSFVLDVSHKLKAWECLYNFYHPNTHPSQHIVPQIFLISFPNSVAVSTLFQTIDLGIVAHLKHCISKKLLTFSRRF